MVLLQAGGMGSLSSLGLILIMIVIFYFFMIRPQMKRQKELKKFQESIAKGDRVIVSGGIFGRVAEVREESLLVEVDSNTKIRVLRSSVYRDASDVNQSAN